MHTHMHTHIQSSHTHTSLNLLQCVAEAPVRSFLCLSSMPGMYTEPLLRASAFLTVYPSPVYTVQISSCPFPEQRPEWLHCQAFHQSSLHILPPLEAPCTPKSVPLLTHPFISVRLSGHKSSFVEVRLAYILRSEFTSSILLKPAPCSTQNTQYLFFSTQILIITVLLCRLYLAPTALRI